MAEYVADPGDLYSGHAGMLRLLILGGARLASEMISSPRSTVRCMGQLRLKADRSVLSKSASIPAMASAMSSRRTRKLLTT